MTTQAAADWKARLAPHLLSLLRIVVAIMFIQSGTMKLFGFPIGMPPQAGPLVVFSEVWFAGVLEVVGGGLLLIGLCTRPVAFVLSGEMAVAYWQVHAPHSPWTVVNHGELSVAYCFLFLYMSVQGGGPWSIDTLIRRKRSP